MKFHPPKWADKFLQWYCRTDLLEEIQGDAYELYDRTAKRNKRLADWMFVWNVLRFFRRRNIHKSATPQFSNAMVKNVLLVSLRNFLRQPGGTLLNLFGLVISFVCAIFILLWVNFEFSFDRFHPDINQLYRVMTHVEGNGDIQTYNVASVAMDVSSIPEVENIVSIYTGSRWPSELCFKPQDHTQDCIYLSGIYASEKFFSVFNFPIIHGDQNPLLHPKSIAISEKMAALLYGGENPIGKTFKIDNWQEVSIASVFKDVPTNSSMQFDFVLPFAVLKKEWGVNDEVFAENFFDTYIQTNTSVTADALTAKLNHVQVLTEEFKNQKLSYQAVPFVDWRLHTKFENGKQSGGRIDYVILFIVVGALVVFMAIVNFINMTTARATTRAKEIGIRKVTGAFRSSIILQFIGESSLIVGVAFLLAALITQLALPYFNSVFGEQINGNLLNGMIPLYLLAFLVMVSLLAGLYPAFVLSSFQPIKILKGQLGQVNSSQQLRKSLLVLQLSVSIGIIIFSGVLYRQLNFITEKNLGFDRENMIRMEPTASLFKNFDAFKNEVGKHASILSIGASATNPLNTEGGNTGVSWPGKPKDLRITFKTIACSYEFPETLGLKIIEGRTFQSQPQDSLRTEVLVTEETVKAMGLVKPVGETITIGDANCVIIGVVNDFHTTSLHEMRLPVILHRTDYMHTSAVYVKYQPGTAQQSLAALNEIYKKFEHDFTMRYWFQDDTFNEIYKTEITAARMILFFTLVAFTISALGIIGLATYNVLRRAKEIGVRRVFGATVAQVFGVLTREFSWVLTLAVVISSPLAWWAAERWLEGFAYRINMPWWIFAITYLGVALITVVIICLQGFRTVTTNPGTVLRTE